MNGTRTLLDGPISVIWADLDQHSGLGWLLSDRERDRAGRFHDPINRDRYVAARGLLRGMLGERMGVDPRAVAVEVGAYGKPRVVTEIPLAFNVSHSASEALFAFGSHGEIGVDIEHIRPLDVTGLAASCFSAQERRQLEELRSPAARLEAFFDGWVRKEAVLKADGRGLGIELGSFSVSLSAPVSMLAAPRGVALTRWHLQSVDAGPRARAALAVYS